ncbi:MAG TPA: porin family protein [Gemmatimonadaceae bacterium]
MHLRAHHLPLTTIALLLAVPARAQVMTAPAPRIRYGIVAGLNFAKLGGGDVTGSGSRTGFVGGAYLDKPLGAGLSLRPALLLSLEGASTDGVDGGDTSGSLKLDYLRLPILVRYAFPTPGSTHPFIALGPSVGVRVGCALTGSSQGASGSISCKDANDFLSGGFDTKPVVVAGRIEAGLDFAAGSETVTVGAGYTHGLTKALEVLGAVARNRVWTVYAGVTF